MLKSTFWMAKWSRQVNYVLSPDFDNVCLCEDATPPHHLSILMTFMILGNEHLYKYYLPPYHFVHRYNLFMSVDICLCFESNLRPCDRCRTYVDRGGNGWWVSHSRWKVKPTIFIILIVVMCRWAVCCPHSDFINDIYDFRVKTHPIIASSNPTLHVNDNIQNNCRCHVNLVWICFLNFGWSDIKSWQLTVCGQINLLPHFTGVTSVGWTQHNRQWLNRMWRIVDVTWLEMFRWHLNYLIYWLVGGCGESDWWWCLRPSFRQQINNFKF